VREEARGQGVARAVIEALIRQEPHRPLYLMCRARLESFYARFGFRCLEPEEMPPYFRRMYHLAIWLNRLQLFPEPLRVMCLK
ncbi:MAG: hypothetical protein N2049_07170, partial [Anaerolineales bacterium]|nr:hypothetical protein [Anaerolineales bacterium]